jgi:soluble lytic murein transglycosylase
MRQESGYDPEAVSYADAIGLLQMLPSTTERVAERLGITYAREQLFDPTWNARYASTYVKGLVERYDTPLAFAAFNGGGHRVTRWLEEGGPTDFDLFVERIPIDQTRNYIRRVTTHYAKYLYLRDPRGGWPLRLPVRVGE